ncbi:MAG: virulence RhuM family protein [Bacteroidales bacterium]|jgi:hypothetical protein|nr:virulence RhuM family protein [Bacteroidales bacterium]
MEPENEIVLYQPNEEVKLEVRLEEETVWLNQQQMAILFNATKQNISLHINNIYKEGELLRDATVKEYLTVQQEGSRQITRRVLFYNLDVIISVGYRVKSIRGTQFRQWANRVLKDYLLRGYSINSRIERLENRMAQTEEKIDFFVRTSLPPVQGIFYDGQVFDAYTFASNLIRSAKKSIVLIDNYIDDTVLLLLDKRQTGVQATIYTKSVDAKLKLDIDRHNKQYKPIEIRKFDRSHDRFLMIDHEVYHIGASLKDLGRKWFAFCKMEVSAKDLLEKTEK